MSDIPREIVAEFLSRVPARSLLRFRSVSKTWRSIIDSPHFIKKHLNRTLQTESDRKIVLRGDDLFWEADLDTVEKTDAVHYTRLDCPFRSQDRVRNVIGSCHGILCLGGGHRDDTIALWNPTTREMFNIPSSKLTDGFHLGLGFGYDKASDDYKVLRIIQQRADCGGTVASVYSVKLKSWRKIDRCPFHLKFGISNGVLASGSLHFKCRINPEDEYDDAIVAFDLETEEYRLVPQPEFPAENGKNFYMNVEAFGGSLCMMYYYSESKSLDIWVMKEECWRKVITIGELSDSVWGSFLKGVSYVKPVAYSRSGKEVFMAHNDILPLWYDLDKRTIRYVGFNVSHRMAFMEHHLYCGSLVKLAHNNGAATMLKIALCVWGGRFLSYIFSCWNFLKHILIRQNTSLKKKE